MTVILLGAANRDDATLDGILQLTAHKTRPHCGVTVALAPSLGTTTRVWAPVVDALLGRPDVEVLLFDLPGHGSAEPRNAVVIEELADELAGQVESVRQSPHVVLAGISMGGAIAVEAARLGRMPVAGVASFNSALRFGSHADWSSIISQARREGTAAFDPAATQRGWFTDAFAHGQGVHEVAQVLRHLAAVDLQSYVACCKALQEYDCDLKPMEITVPGLAVGGASDTATPPRLMQALAEAAPSFRYAELPGAHLAALECAPAAARLLTDLISLAMSEQRLGQSLTASIRPTLRATS